MTSSLRPHDPTREPSSNRTQHGSATPTPTDGSAWSSVRIATNGVTWRVRPGCEGLVYGPGAPNWLHLVAEPQAEPVKRNVARRVWRVTVEGQELFAKVYRETGLSGKARQILRGPGCELEWRACAHARRHQIATVEPVACGTIGWRGLGGPSVLITRALPDAIPLHLYWSRRVLAADPPERRRRANAVIEAAASALARAHQSGFHHRDLHAGNLLAVEAEDSQVRVVFVDLHNVRVNSRVSDGDAIRNLAQFNQWFRRRATRTERLRFLRHYRAFRDEFSRRTDSGPSIRLLYRELVEALNDAVDRHGRMLWAKRDRVACRDGKYFCRLRTQNGWRGHAYLWAKHPTIYSRASQMQFTRTQWRQWLRDPLELVGSERATVVKESHTAHICRTQLPTDGGPLEVICKQTRPRTWLKKLYYLFIDSRNIKSWKRGYQLLNRELPTARPLAVMERRRAGLLRDSILVTEAVADATDFDVLLRGELPRQDPARLRGLKDQLLVALVRLVKDLQARGFAHRDFKAPNVMVQWDPSGDEPPRLTLIDLDGLLLRRRLSRRDRLRPLMRLNVSLDEAHIVTRTDRLRFLKAYMTGPGRTDRNWKVLWRELARMSDRKRVHKEERRRWKLKHYGRT